MAQQTPEQYYNDEDNYGSYQYATLKDIVDVMVMDSEDSDNYIKNTKRSTIIRHAKDAIREVTFRAANEELAIEVTVPQSLCWPLPQDFVNYKKVSKVVRDLNDGSLRLQVLDINYGINTADGYLQDDTGKLLFDDQGFILQADSSNGYARPYKSYGYTSCYNPTVDSSAFSKSGEFVIDKKRGQFLFGSNLMDNEIVIEYVSDGLSAQLTESQITVHKHLRTAIEDYVYLSCIARRANVPYNEKDRARKKYDKSLHQAQLMTSDITMLRIARSLMNSTQL